MKVLFDEMMGIIPYCEYDDDLPTMNDDFDYPFDVDDIESEELADFLEKCFETEVDEEWSVNELLNVSGMGCRMMSSIHL